MQLHVVGKGGKIVEVPLARGRGGKEYMNTERREHKSRSAYLPLHKEPASWTGYVTSSLRSTGVFGITMWPHSSDIRFKPDP